MENEQRGCSRIVRTGRQGGCPYRVVSGWRGESIARCLDFCARVDGYAHIDWSDAEARPVWGTSEYWRARARTAGEAMKENNRHQAAKWRERARQDWYAYYSAYLARHPGCKPVGFDRWSRVYLKAWRADPESVLGLVNVTSGAYRDSNTVAGQRGF